MDRSVGGHDSMSHSAADAEMQHVVRDTDVNFKHLQTDIGIKGLRLSFPAVLQRLADNFVLLGGDRDPETAA